MELKARRKQFLLAGPLAAAVIAVTITACGGGSAPAFAQGSAPGHWTQAEVSQFAAANGSDGSDTEDSCITGYFAQDMSFGNAMAVTSVTTSDNMSDAQVAAALVAKYGTAEGNAIDGQYKQVISDSVSNCGD
jgi:hypothetical protein